MIKMKKTLYATLAALALAVTAAQAAPGPWYVWADYPLKGEMVHGPSRTSFASEGECKTWMGGTTFTDSKKALESYLKDNGEDTSKVTFKCATE